MPNTGVTMWIFAGLHWIRSVMTPEIELRAPDEPIRTDRKNRSGN
jgi:hypothetical protein